VLDGPAFCRIYRECGDAAPIVLVTAANQQAVKDAMEACGAVAYIPKPFDINVLLDMVGRLAVR
jgi:CheY-like chemotaxis protein